MNAYIFDVDGVLNNMQTRKITKPEVIPLLVSLLQNGSPLSFISGRGLLSLRSQVIKLIEEYVDKHPTLDKHILDQIYVSGEFGGVSCVHVNGVRHEAINHDLIIPEEIRRGLHLIAFQYADYAFVATEKQTVFTVVGNPELKEEEFQQQKKTIIDDFKKVTNPYPELEVHSDRMAINIRHKKANKSYATDLFLSWLKEKGVTPEKYFVFGDSPSDLEMGTELDRQKLPFEFIYVGEKSELNESKHTFPVTVTKGYCDEGTVEYLISHQQ